MRKYVYTCFDKRAPDGRNTYISERRISELGDINYNDVDEFTNKRSFQRSREMHFNS
jgi:hypothetical protein